MRLLDSEGLAAKGIKFSPVHIWRLIRAGAFPKPIKVGSRNHWIESEVDEFIAAKLAQREIHAA